MDCTRVGKFVYVCENPGERSILSTRITHKTFVSYCARARFVKTLRFSRRLHNDKCVVVFFFLLCAGGAAFCIDIYMMRNIFTRVYTHNNERFLFFSSSLEYYIGVYVNRIQYTYIIIIVILPVCGSS